MKHVKVQNGQILIRDIQENDSFRGRNMNYLVRPSHELEMTIIQNNIAITLKLDVPDIIAITNELSNQVSRVSDNE